MFMGEDVSRVFCGGKGWGQKAVVLLLVIIWTGKITGESNTRLMGLNIMVLKLAADAKEKMLSIV